MRSWTVIVAALVVAAAACGGDDAESGSMSEPQTTTTDAATTTAPTTTAPTTTEATTTTTMVTTTTTEASAFLVTAPAYGKGEPIPVIYTCDGDDISPAYAISMPPDGTVSLVVIMDDPDAPGGTWDHWVAFDVDVTDEIPEDVGELGTAGSNSWGTPGYGGPCPPSGTHRYFTKVYALDTTLGLEAGATKDDVLAAAEGHILAEAETMGTYSR